MNTYHGGNKFYCQAVENKKIQIQGVVFLWRLNEYGEDDGTKELWILIGKG